MTRSEISEKLAQKKKRLQAYYDRELYMLSENAVMSYGVGSRNLQRYNTDLGEIRKAIRELEEEVDGLGNLMKGGSVRKAVGVVPRDF